MDNNIELLTTNELALYLKVSRWTLNQWRKEKSIPFIKMNRCIRYRLSDVNTWLEQQTCTVK